MCRFLSPKAHNLVAYIYGQIRATYAVCCPSLTAPLTRVTSPAQTGRPQYFTTVLKYCSTQQQCQNWDSALWFPPALRMGVHGCALVLGRVTWWEPVPTVVPADGRNC